MDKKRIGIIGGTGKEGQGLAYKWGKAGFDILIGSRTLEKAQLAAATVNQLIGQDAAIGTTNSDAVAKADVCVLTVPFSVHKEMLYQLKNDLMNKVLIDVTVPLVPPRISVFQPPEAGSALMEAVQILDESTEVVDAFQNISYENLLSDKEIECDVLVCGSNREVRQQVIDIIEAGGMTAWDAGPKENAVVVEGMTSVLLGINKKYGSKSSGIRLTGVNK